MEEGPTANDDSISRLMLLIAEIFITSITSHRKEGYRPQKQEVDFVPQGELELEKSLFGG